MFDIYIYNNILFLAEGSGLSAVIETDQDTRCCRWVATGRPGLFITDDLKILHNSIFQVTEGGVYYVSANLIIMTKRASSHDYYRLLEGGIRLDSAEGRLKLSSSSSSSSLPSLFVYLFVLII